MSIRMHTSVIGILLFVAALTQIAYCQEDPVKAFCRGKSQDASQAFRAGDNFVITDPTESKSRQILGTFSGNELLDANRLLNSAIRTLEVEKEAVAQRAAAAGRAERSKRQTDLREPALPDDEPQSLMSIPEPVPQTCPFTDAAEQPCGTGPFREHTGRCTNLVRKTWGMAGTQFTRILEPRYEDGVNEYRTTEFSSGKPLKSPREISVTVTTTNVVLNQAGPSAHTMQWGQFITHEFTQIGDMEANRACCPDVVCAGEKLTNDQIKVVSEQIKIQRKDVCIQIENFNDPVFGPYICIQQARSKIAPRHDCSSGGGRQQMNMITHVFDGSAVYGSSKMDADDLRSFTSGKLKTQTVNGAILPPCARQAPSCPFKAGDKRINTTPNLAAYHTLFINLHNKIASQLIKINPKWDDERLYQEARRIVSGIEANIHFNEYLPIIVGSSIINKYRLGSYTGFSSRVNPSIPNELAGAAFRFGHSTIDGFVSLIKDNGGSDFVNLTTLFFNVQTIHQDGIKQCVRGMSKDLPWIVDRNFPAQMRNEMYNKRNDIVSININRGRDHGFASYLDYRRRYGLSVPRSWSDLKRTHPAQVVDQLQKVYTSVEDIELYIGGVTENHVSGGLTGETFANIIADGFNNVRRGDRLYFENTRSGLTRAQRAAIRGYTLSRLFCDGSDIDKVSSKGFFRIGFNGAVEVECSKLPKLDISLWKSK